MADHHEVVEGIYSSLYHKLEDTRWDAVMKEVDYYDVDTGYDMQHTVGEFDILLIDWEEKDMFYFEIKTGKNPRISKGWEQIERAQNHFAELGYDLEGQVYTPEEITLEDALEGDTW